MMKNLLLLLIISTGLGSLHAQTIPTSELRVHDPVMAYADGTYYLFATGRGIAVWKSSDLQQWERLNPVFATPPEWTTVAVPTFKGHFWAPDISYHQGKYYLYYSVSAFGKNTSAIGLATNVTLDPTDPSYKWEDQGKVIQSYPQRTHWNAIDPHLMEDDNGKPYLSFGSFWGGLQIVPLKEDRTKLDVQDTIRLHTLASRKPILPEDQKNTTAQAGDNPIEAPFLYKKNDYYYLFASIDYCCRGIESTYKMIVGRSKSILGPYVDASGKDMAHGGGELLLAGDERWQGVGHNAVYHFDGQDYLVFHGYDGHDNGIAKLRIEPLQWSDQGWPSLRQKN
jgi:arabinan endo-1,5-alpha-L-arabinosidase